MLLTLTFDLIFRPAHGFAVLQRLTVSDAAPSALQHAASVGAVAVIASLIGTLAAPGADAHRATLVTLGAVAAYLGAAALASSAAPYRATPHAYAERFGGAVCLPILASGTFNAIPSRLAALVATLAGLMLAYRAALCGARTLLGLDGSARLRAASAATLVAGSPVLLLALLRAFTPWPG